MLFARQQVDYFRWLLSDAALLGSIDSYLLPDWATSRYGKHRAKHRQLGDNKNSCGMCVYGGD
jgi:hypothetical protein